MRILELASNAQAAHDSRIVIKEAILVLLHARRKAVVDALGLGVLGLVLLLDFLVFLIGLLLFASRDKGLANGGQNLVGERSTIKHKALAAIALDLAHICNDFVVLKVTTRRKRNVCHAVIFNHRFLGAVGDDNARSGDAEVDVEHRELGLLRTQEFLCKLRDDTLGGRAHTRGIAHTADGILHNLVAKLELNSAERLLELDGAEKGDGEAVVDTLAVAERKVVMKPARSRGGEKVLAGLGVLIHHAILIVVLPIVDVLVRLVVVVGIFLKLGRVGRVLLAAKALGKGADHGDLIGSGQQQGVC
eukprot:m.221648 g.221648  ORF g.221648 m.221648 type:complete len:304 (+) comp10810_c0_seq3:2845-3756(+)